MTEVEQDELILRMCAGEVEPPNVVAGVFVKKMQADSAEAEQLAKELLALKKRADAAQMRMVELQGTHKSNDETLREWLESPKD